MIRQSQGAVIDLRSGASGGVDRDRNAVVLLPEDVRRLMSPRGVLGAFRSFERVELAVDDVRSLLSVKPRLAARWMARGPSELVDASGARRRIGWGGLGGDLAATLANAARWTMLGRAIAADLRRLDEAPARPGAPAGEPLYLRADLWYGLRAGGSLGHIAGVLKGLRKLGHSPVLASVEAIPTTPPETPLIPLRTAGQRWLHAEQAQLAFNRTILHDVAATWQGAPPRFVYQRHALNCYAGLALARRFCSPFILEYNGPEVWVADNWGRPLRERGLATACEAVSLRGADLVVTVSDVLRDSLLVSGLPPHRVITIPNAVDLDVFRPDTPADALRRSLAIADRTVVGFIGTFGRWHGVEKLIAAFPAVLASATPDLPPPHLLLVGDGARMGAAREAVAALGLDAHVTLTGLVPQQDGPAHIAAFDIAVAPTDPNPDGTPFFGSPTKLFEYMAAGRAIVASALGQVGDVLRDGETALLTRPDDVGSLAAALSRLCRDPALRLRLGAAARGEAEAKHGYETRARALIDALAGAGNGGRGPER